MVGWKNIMCSLDSLTYECPLTSMRLERWWDWCLNKSIYSCNIVHLYYKIKMISILFYELMLKRCINCLSPYKWSLSIIYLLHKTVSIILPLDQKWHNIMHIAIAHFFFHLFSELWHTTFSLGCSTEWALCLLSR